MQLSPGTRSGPCEILSPICEGRMGTSIIPSAKQAYFKPGNPLDIGSLPQSCGRADGRLNSDTLGNLLLSTRSTRFTHSSSDKRQTRPARTLVAAPPLSALHCALFEEDAHFVLLVAYGEINCRNEFASHLGCGIHIRAALDQQCR